MSGHTPGPWTVEIGMDALVRCPDGRTFNAGDAIYHEDNKANARLIAAAPELLAALKNADLMLTVLPCRDSFEETARQQARAKNQAAIAKAEGR